MYLTCNNIFLATSCYGENDGFPELTSVQVTTDEVLEV